MSALRLSASILEGKQWLRPRIFGEGAACPLCERWAKVNVRNVYGTMARNLILAHQRHGYEFFHMTTLTGHRNAEESKMKYWGLIEQEKDVLPTGGRRGWWRVTPKGVRFIRGLITITKYVHVWDKRPLKFDGPQVNILDCLGEEFDYDELMARRSTP